jgi:uncharacterized protein YgiM (DUF1202 family)
LHVPPRLGKKTYPHMLLQSVAILGVALVTWVLTSGTSVAQSCTDCTVYAATELNLRQGPDLNSAVLRIVPVGASLYRISGGETNGYAPVTYDSVPGWVIALGLDAPVGESGASSSVDAAIPPASDDLRVTLSPLMLRTGPSIEAEPILVMPEGSVVTLTREGSENGYVTVDYDGVPGWAYADLLSELTAR